MERRIRRTANIRAAIVAACTASPGQVLCCSDVTDRPQPPKAEDSEIEPRDGSPTVEAANAVKDKSGDAPESASSQSQRRTETSSTEPDHGSAMNRLTTRRRRLKVGDELEILLTMKIAAEDITLSVTDASGASAVRCLEGTMAKTARIMSQATDAMNPELWIHVDPDAWNRGARFPTRRGMAWSTARDLRECLDQVLGAAHGTRLPTIIAISRTSPNLECVLRVFPNGNINSWETWLSDLEDSIADVMANGMLQVITYYLRSRRNT